MKGSTSDNTKNSLTETGAETFECDVYAVFLHLADKLIRIKRHQRHIHNQKVQFSNFN